MEGVLFPYEKVKKGSHIALYGYNNISQIFFEQLSANKYCEIVLWVIESDEEVKLSHPFCRIEQIINADLDYIVIAEEDSAVARKKMEIITSTGIDQKKVIWSPKYKLNYVRFPTDDLKVFQDAENYLQLVSNYCQGTNLVDGYFYQSDPELSIRGLRSTLDRVRLYGLDKIMFPEMNVLDIGCNVGFLDLEISKYVNSVTGVDIDENFVSAANTAQKIKKVNNCRFICADIKRWNSQEHYDLIIACAVHNWIGFTMDEFISYIEEHLNSEGYILFESNSLDCIDTTFESYVKTLQEMHYKIENSSMSDSRIGKRKAVLLKKVVD